MGRVLTEQQIADYHRDGFLVIPDFVTSQACHELKTRAEEILASFDAESDRSVFTTNEQSRHADQQFIDSATGIHCFFEEEAFDEQGILRQAKEVSVNKIGHAMHDLDPVFEAFSYTEKLATVASDIGMPDPLALQSMYICKQQHIGGEVSCHQDATFCIPIRSQLLDFGLRLRMPPSKMVACGQHQADIKRHSAKSLCAMRLTMVQHLMFLILHLSRCLQPILYRLKPALERWSFFTPYCHTGVA